MDKQPEEQQITIPVLTDEQQALIALRWRDTQRTKYKEAGASGVKPEKVRKLYLITFSGHMLALPDEHGRAVHHQSAYAWIELEGDHIFYSGEVEIVAQGDGRWLKSPIRAVLTAGGITALAEVNPDILHL